MYAADPAHDALLIDGERIAWTGESSTAGPADVVIDAGGALVTPAFVDAHVHATSTGIVLDGLDLASARSLTDALGRLADYCAANPGRHVLGHGWDETGWPEGRPPTREEVDRASNDAVVYLTRIDVHSAIASSALLARCPDVIGMDGYSDDGWLRRDAHHSARSAALDTISVEQRQEAQRATRRHAASLGIAAFHELGGPEISSVDDFAGMLALAASEPGPEVVGYWGELGGIERARELGALGAAGDLFADGAIGSHTACLRSVYADESHTGSAYLSAAQVRDHVIACTRAGLQAGFHVIGDGAMDSVIAGFREAADTVGPQSIRHARHRLEHVEMIDDDQLRTMADLSIIASVQPVFDALWGGDSGMYVDRLGRERASAMNPFARMLEFGVPLAFGSDAPVTPLGPWDAVRAAVRHRTPAQRIDVARAFSAHTVGAWRSAFVDDCGTLEVGSPAYAVIWDTDRFPSMDAGQPMPQALTTFARGQRIHG